ncbi:hypothetical protein JVU11DRAFT_7387 [Chiua virens]|nr:hypothetical protein JVU11DRAFT_7387 [Chiua virens]
MDIIPAVGKFHLSAHKQSCFPRFSLMFIPGAGHVDGEILETLWASFNKISPSARAMSLAHRQEVYDDYMRDSNWKKLVGLAKSLHKKYKTALAGVKSTKEPFEELTRSLEAAKIQEWSQQAVKADFERGETLDIYSLKIEKAPTLAEIRLSLVQSAPGSERTQSSVNWLIEGISIENAHPSTVQETAIAMRRQRLMGRVIKFNQMARDFTTNVILNGSSLEILEDDPLFCTQEDQEVMEDDIPRTGPPSDEDEEFRNKLEDELGYAYPESMRLHMPSSLPSEDKSQIGQVNDCLSSLKNHLGQKAVLYRINFRSSTSNRTDTRSKQDIRKVVLKINSDVRSYHRAIGALKALGASEDLLEKYRIIQPEDLAVSKDITEENRFNQSSHILPWFWRIGILRVSWLKARARYQRWREELDLIKCEMLWTTLWFKHRQKEWQDREEKSEEPGQQAYAAKQQQIWIRFAETAEKTFHEYIAIQ